MLDEHKLDNSIGGWFELPWRSGWNAAMLARSAYINFRSYDSTNAIDGEISYRLGQWILNRRSSPSIYEIAGEDILSVSALISTRGLQAAGFLLTGLRCAQLVVSNSSGGGEVYNAILRARFERVPSHWPEILRAEVREARCWDAIGAGPALMNDHNDRLRRAFCIAWDRGLYRAAYALPRAV